MINQQETNLHTNKKSDTTSLTYNKYQDFVKSTCIFKPLTVPRNLSYLFCGVVEEMCEFREAVKLGQETAVLKELGDVCWYLTAMSLQLDVLLADLVLSQKENVPKKEENVPKKEEKTGDLFTEMLLLTGPMGGKIKKAIRDDKDMLTADKKCAILDSICGIFRHLSGRVCPVFGTDLLGVMQINKTKIQSRFARGVIHGDGDNR